MKDTPTARAARRQQWLEQIDGALRSYGMAAAGQLALQALADGVEHPAVLNLAASVRYGEGRIRRGGELAQAGTVARAQGSAHPQQPRRVPESARATPTAALQGL